MGRYVKPWNVGGAMKANAYYGSKMLTRRKRRRRKPQASDFSFRTNLIALLCLPFLFFLMLVIASL